MNSLLNSNTSYINLNNDEFEETINSLIKNFNIQEVVETGTFNGLGSTTIFAKTGITVYSIESCKAHYEEAIKNLKKYSNVFLKYGSSLNVSEMEEFIKQDSIYNSDVVLSKTINVDGPKDFYIQEINGFSTEKIVNQDLLIPLINNNKKQIVFLDSAGGVGYLEYLKFMNLPNKIKKHKVLILDDIAHVKHYRSVVDLKQKGFDVKISKGTRFAYCLFV